VLEDFLGGKVVGEEALELGKDGLLDVSPRPLTIQRRTSIS
jgi:hypothetical protein